MIPPTVIPIDLARRDIWRMPADGGPLQNVTRFPESGLFLEEPTISPDGRWLVYNKGRRLALDAHDRARRVVRYTCR